MPYGYPAPNPMTQPYRDNPTTMSEFNRAPSTEPVQQVYYPPRPLSEKRQRQLMEQQRSHGLQAARASIDDTATSVISQPCTASVYSTSTAPPPTSFPNSPNNPKALRPQFQQHHRSPTEGSTVSYGSDNVNDPLISQAAIRNTPSPSYPYPGTTHGSPPAGPVSEGAAHRRQPSYQASEYSQAYPEHSPPSAWMGPGSPMGVGVGGPIASGSGSNSRHWDGGSIGASATVDRGDGTSAQVYQAKNSQAGNAGLPPARPDEEEDPYIPTLSEIPPTYESIQQQRARRMAASSSSQAP